MSLFDLKGRVALVTGGNGGIGLGMARGLAGAGAAVAVAGRNKAKSEAAAAELAKLGVKTAVIEVDVTSEASCRKAVADTARTLGRLDILVNNAGINIRKPAHELALARGAESRPFKAPRRPSEPVAVDDLERLFIDVANALRAIDFFKTRNADGVMRTVPDSNGPRPVPLMECASPMPM